MKNNKKIVAVAASLVAASAILVGGAFAFFVDKDWTSDTGTNGTVFIEVEDLEFTNSENINPGDYDKDVWTDAIENGSTPSLREGTEHKLTFRVDNVGTKSIMTRNVITISCENVLYDPVYYSVHGETAYAKALEVAPDNHMYIQNASNPLTVVQDELENYYIKGTELKYNQANQKYEYVDATTGEKLTFTKDDTSYRDIVHWRFGNLPADAYYLLYDVKLAKDNPQYAGNSSINQNLVIQTEEVDCIPTQASQYTGTDLWALHSSDLAAEFEVFSRNFFSSKSDIVAIRYVTPQISLAAPVGSIEDADGDGTSQTNTTTQGGLVRENDLDSVFYTYWIAMDKDCPNMYNGATVYIDIEVQAMQWRNTSDAEWETLFSKTYMLTVENAEQSYYSIYGNAGLLD